MTTISLRVSDDLAREIADLSSEASRPKSFVIRQAIMQYIEDYQDYRDAKKRLQENDEEYVCLEEMKARLGV
jgi:predicted DNA-binding protein